jgi:hypothetical protein
VIILEKSQFAETKLFTKQQILIRFFISAYEVETDSCNAKPQQSEAWNTWEAQRSFGNAKRDEKNPQALADEPESVKTEPEPIAEELPIVEELRLLMPSLSLLRRLMVVHQPIMDMLNSQSSNVELSLPSWLQGSMEI